MDTQEGDICPRCHSNNQTFRLKFFYISLDEMVLKCASLMCMYPFKNFKYKNVKDGTISTPQFTQRHKPPLMNRIKTDTLPDFNVTYDEKSIEKKMQTMELSGESKLDANGFNISSILDMGDDISGSFQFDFSFSSDLNDKPQDEPARNAIQATEVKTHMNHSDDWTQIVNCSVPVKQESEIKSAKQLSEIIETKPSAINITVMASSTGNKEKDNSTTATISRYLDFIKAKHKKRKKPRKSYKMKSEKMDDDMSKPGMEVEKKFRPLDILKTIQNMG